MGMNQKTARQREAVVTHIVGKHQIMVYVRLLPTSYYQPFGLQNHFRSSLLCSREDLYILKFRIGGNPTDRGKDLAVR